MSEPRALAAIVLAAGEGKRLRPLTAIRPKPLCPLGNSTLLDLALRRAEAVVSPGSVAVNAHYLADQIIGHVGDRAHISYEEGQALGTAGAVGALRDWIDGRDVLIVNGDVYLRPEPDLAGFVAGWDRRRPRLLVVQDNIHPDFEDQWSFAGVSLLPAATAAALKAAPTGLYEVVWREADLDLVPTDSTYLDCGDPSSYLRANLLASGGTSVIGEGARIEGEVDRCVIWPGAVVHAGERLVEQIRAIDSGCADVTVAAPQ